MNDTIIGVIIGGIIGTIIPFVTLFLDHYRWKRSAKLEYLKAERNRLEQLFNKSLKELSTGMSEDNYSSDTATDIFLLMPKEVSDRFQRYVLEKKKTKQTKKAAYLDLTVIMKKELVNIDNDIKKLIS